MTARAPRDVTIPVLALLLVGLVLGDVARRTLGRRETRSRPAAAAPASRAGSAPATGAARGASRTLAADVAHTVRLDSATRAAVLRRIDLEGPATYLPAMLSAGDSALHRWPDDHAGRPIRIGVVREAIPGFREVFVANLGWAISRWNGVGLPIFLEQSSDTAGADIVVSWVDRLDSNRAGRADLTWETSGRLVHVHVTLALHTPDGRPVLPPQMVALALHELGHALGLGHSPVAADALYPKTSATELTARDRRTVALLYSIPPGSFK
jgi:hypothetical protein